MPDLPEAPPTISLLTVTDGQLLDQARQIVQEYADSLDIPLDFQDFEREMAEFPGDYTPPGGALLLDAANLGP